jgi:hypothetical protein
MKCKYLRLLCNWNSCFSISSTLWRSQTRKWSMSQGTARRMRPRKRKNLPYSWCIHSERGKSRSYRRTSRKSLSPSKGKGLLDMLHSSHLRISKVSPMFLGSCRRNSCRCCTFRMGRHTLSKRGFYQRTSLAGTLTDKYFVLSPI